MSLFSNPVEHPIGVFGDAAIYSFSKTLPVPDGGMLIVANDDPLAEEPGRSPPIGVIFKELLPFIKRAVLRFSDNVRLYPYLPQKLTQSRNKQNRTMPKTSAGLPQMPESYYYDKNIQDMTASKITRQILRCTCPESIVRQRRNNYRMLYEVVQNSELFKPLYRELPDGVCPLVLPVMVENRELAEARLNEMGIYVGQWWAGFHRAFDWSEFPEARYLKEHVLAIPIHQRLNRKHVEYMSSCLKQGDTGH